jgi:hypothetical protein
MESRIGAWERGIDTPSATYIPTLAGVLGVEPLALFDVDPAAPSFTVLRMAAGVTLQALSKATGNLLHIASLVDESDLHLICWLSISPVA